MAITSGEGKIFPLYNTTRPHVEISYDSSALAGAYSESSEKNIAIIGSATDGNPSTVYELTNMAQAKTIFQSGELVDAISLLWNPSSTANGVGSGGGKVYAVRVEDANPASLVEGGLTFTSNVYGETANNITVELDKNPVNDAFRLTVEYPTKSYSQVYDNLGQLYRVAYTGSQAVATITITKASNGEATSLVLKAGASADSLAVIKSYDLTLDKYSTVIKVMSDIQLLPDLSVTTLTSGANNSIASKFLDAVDGANIKATTEEDVNGASVQVVSGQVVTANAGDIVDKLSYDAYVSVTADQSKDVSVFDEAPLTGGKTGDTPISWADKLELFAQTDAYYIVPLSQSSSVHAEVKAFVNEQYELGHNMRAFVGGGFNETVSQAIARQLHLKDARVALTDTSLYFTDSSSGSALHLPAYMVAAVATGVASGLQIGGAITNKFINAISIDQTYTSTDLDNLNANGVIAVEHVTNRGSNSGFRFVEDVTTYNSTSDKDKARVSLGEVTDFLFTDLRYFLEENYIGTNVSSTSASYIKTGVVSFLEDKVSEGLIVDYDSSSIQVYINGSKVYISFTVSPSQTIDYIVVTGTYSNYTSTATDAGTSD